jgi:hypothetical protein
VLYANNLLALLNAGTGERIWEYKINMSIFKLALSPFDSSSITSTNIFFQLFAKLRPHTTLVASNGLSLVFIDDLFVHRAPSGKKTNALAITPTTESGGRFNQEGTMVQLTYHNANDGQLFALFSTEIFCVDTQAKQLIYSAVIETNSPLSQVLYFNGHFCLLFKFSIYYEIMIIKINEKKSNAYFFKILPCASRDAFFLVHHNGTVSFRVARVKSSSEDGLHARLVLDQSLNVFFNN